MFSSPSSAYSLAIYIKIQTTLLKIISSFRNAIELNKEIINSVEVTSPKLDDENIVTSKTKPSPSISYLSVFVIYVAIAFGKLSFSFI